MRSKRKQKRQLKLQSPSKEPKKLPDPFSANNEELVEAEVQKEDACPCCVDRQRQLAFDKEMSAYLAWFEETKEKE